MRLPDLRRESLERFPLTSWSRLAIQTAVRLPSDEFSPTEWKPAEKIPFGEIRTSETKRNEDVGNVSCGDEIENKGSDDRRREMRTIGIGVSIVKVYTIVVVGIVGAVCGFVCFLGMVVAKIYRDINRWDVVSWILKLLRIRLHKLNRHVNLRK
ncbi:hypothetical protein RHGRI_016377 [Rhododendron griersonianum]|uniref:Transmembrane protein n=1 Tax=Rhododendron griersonianum TaxID=479676 RepID=A0AAV6JTX1_9ERIC|nr:hypothetical protein RHGRI_016377 [Rhododendron griersonianum]